MERYNYLEVMKEDIINYIEENHLEVENIDWDDLYDELWAEDTVTGNGYLYRYAGIETDWEAEECLCHNLDLLFDAFDTFGTPDPTNLSPLSLDVTVRCYLLGEAIWKVKEHYGK